MSSRITLYRAAARHCKERRVVSLTDSGKVRLILDDIWDEGFVDAVLEAGQWNMAIRALKIEYTPSVEPAFGYARAFDRPSDWVRTVAMSADEYFNTPLREYLDEGDYFYSEHDEIYIQYVSNDAAYGGDLVKWPQSLHEYAGLKMACGLAHALDLPNSQIANLYNREITALKVAKSRDASRDPTKFPPGGSWVGTRRTGVVRQDYRAGRVL